MVIENVKQREFVVKGPKYREPNKINWKTTAKMLFESIGGLNGTSESQVTL